MSTQASSCQTSRLPISLEDEIQTRKIASKLPKVQLHLHLDGSLSESFIEKRAFANSIRLPCAANDVRHHLLRQKQEAQARDAYNQEPGGNWDVFSFCNQFLQTANELEEATESLVKALIAQRCSVIEIRFCPHLHVERGLNVDDAVVVVANAFRNAVSNNVSCSNVVGGIILCALRSMSPEHTREIIRLAAAHRKLGVIAVDLAGDEGSYPLTDHASALCTAHELGVPLTIHAGEWGPFAAANVRMAVCDIGVTRLGHALALDYDDELRRLVAERRVPVETCLTANCSGGKKVPADAFHLHPLPKMLKDGVCVSGLNCDNLLLSGTVINRPDPTEEIVRARRGCRLSWEQIGQVLINGARATLAHFESENKFNEFVRKFEEEVVTIVESVEAIDHNPFTE